MRLGRVDEDARGPLQLLKRALVGPQVDPVAERVADVPDDVTRVLCRDLLAERRPLLPRRWDRVVELVHQFLVDPEHILGEVVLDAVLRAVDRALGGRRCRPLTEEILRDEALDRFGKVEGLHGHPHRVIDLLTEEDIRPAVAGPIPQLDLRLQRRRAVSVAVKGDDVHVHIRVRFGVSLRHGQADRVNPDGQLAFDMTADSGLLSSLTRCLCAATAAIAALAGSDGDGQPGQGQQR